MKGTLFFVFMIVVAVLFNIILTAAGLGWFDGTVGVLVNLVNSVFWGLAAGIGYSVLES